MTYEMVLEYFAQGWAIVVDDYMGGYTCDDEEEIADAMYEDDYISIEVQVNEAEHRICIVVSNDE